MVRLLFPPGYPGAIL